MKLLMMALLAQDPAPVTETTPDAQESAEDAGSDSAEETSLVDESATEAEGSPQEGGEDLGSEQPGSTSPDPIQRPQIASRETSQRGASLYSEEHNRWNSHEVGDLVTVEVYDALQTEVTAATTTGRSTGQSTRVGALLGLVSQVLIANPTMEIESGELGVEASNDSTFAGNGTTSRENALSTTLTCTVVEILPGGNLKIEGYKEVLVNGETQMVVLHGVVRPQDIKGDNTISSDRLAESRVHVSGQGVVDDRQAPGWGTRVMDHAWPF